MRSLALLLALSLFAAACGENSIETVSDPTDVVTDVSADPNPTTPEQPDDPEPIASARGVTPDTIRVGIAAIDWDRLAELGVRFGRTSSADLYVAALESINDRGAIFGRLLEPYPELFLPVGSVDFDAACSRLAEDEEIFVVIGQALEDQVLCFTQLNDTAAVLVSGMTDSLVGRSDAPYATIWASLEDQADSVVENVAAAGVLAGAIVLLSQVGLRGMWFGGGRRSRRSEGEGGGGAQAIIMVVAIVLMILAPIMAQLIYFAVSRKREYLADASAASFTRYPEGLASALEKISRAPSKLASANKATAPMYIINPLARDGKMAANGSSTHPPIDERVTTALCMVHQRYSTNTFPSWRLAQPFRMVAHNGEINTLSGNRHRMLGRQRHLACEALGDDLADDLGVPRGRDHDRAARGHQAKEGVHAAHVVRQEEDEGTMSSPLVAKLLQQKLRVVQDDLGLAFGA